MTLKDYLSGDVRVQGGLLRIGQPYIQVNTDLVVPSRMVLACDALGRVGRSAFGDEWKNWEERTLYYPSPPLLAGLTIERLKENEQPPRVPPAFPVSVLSNQSTESAAAQKARRAAALERRREWDEEASEREERYKAEIANEREYLAKWKEGFDEHSAGAQALRSAMLLLCRAVADDKLHPHARPIEGGAIFQANAQLLLREDLPEDLVRRGVLSSSGQKSLYILFDRAELEAAFPTVLAEQGRVGDVELENLSPYLRLMIHVSQASNLKEESGDGTGDSVEALGALLREAAPKFGIKEDEISETWAKDLAKGLRWPVARKGRHHKAKPKEVSGHE